VNRRPPWPAQAAERRAADRHHVAALTGIRGYAAGWVVLFHASFAAWQIQPALPPQDALPLIRRGYLAVDLFFVLSGYVLMRSHGEAFRQRGFRAWRPFAAGRLGRVMPLHWIVLGLLCLLTLTCPGGPWIGIAPGGPLVENLALVQSWLGDPLSWNTPAWSLSAEWLAYLAFPLLALAIGQAGRWGCAAVIGGSAVTLALAAGWHGDGGLNHVHVLGLVRCLCEFPMGMAGCRLLQTTPPNGTAVPDRLFWAGLALLALTLATPRLDAVAAPAFLMLVMASGAGSSPAHALFGHPRAVWLGEISFSLYLLHFAWFDLAWQGASRFVPSTGPWVAATVAGACLTLPPLAYLSWRWIERPGQDLGRRLQRRRP
jgi:peptidoglycan/LPS O-acetylase OafA/YrhL